MGTPVSQGSVQRDVSRERADGSGHSCSQVMLKLKFGEDFNPRQFLMKEAFSYQEGTTIDSTALFGPFF